MNARPVSMVAVARIVTALSFVGCVALIVLALWASQQSRDHIAQVETLTGLQVRVAELSVAADALLVDAVDEASLPAFLTRLRRVRSELTEMEDALPAAQRAVAALDEMAELAADAFDRPRANGSTLLGPTQGVLGVTEPAAATLTRMAAFGVTIENVVAELVRERHLEADATVARVSRALGGFAVLFAFLSLAASWFLYRRLGRPTAQLVRVMDRVGLGDASARANVLGRDEMARLGAALNAMLDRRDAAEQELHDRQQELQGHAAMLLESQRIGRIGSWRRTVDSGQLEVSAEVLRILGLAPDAAPPTVDQVREMIHPDDADRYQALHATVTGGRGPTYDTFRMRSGQGEDRHVHIGGDVERDEEGRPMYVAGVIQDVTERVEAQAALDEQRRVMEIASRIARFGGWHVDARTQALTWSDRVCEIHEVPLGTRPTVAEAIVFYAPEHRDRIRAAYERAVRDGVPYDEELQIVTATGRRIWVRTTGEPVRDASGRITGVQGAFQDVDARKRAELRAHQLDHRLRATLERLNDGFVLIDDALRITFANSAAIRIAELWHDTAVAGRLLDDVLPGVMKSRIGDEIRRAMDDGVSTRFDDFDPTTGRWLEIWVDPTGEGLAVGLRDVTVRRDMVERLRSQEAHLANELTTRKALIDSLPANIAVLDASGVITSVNDRWRTFADDNDADDDQVGVSYLQVCDAARGKDAGSGAQVAAGLRAVLADQRSSFVYEYPCHSPSEERWFRLAATPLRTDAELEGAVVMHIDVTEAKRAEAALERIAFEDPLTGYLTRDGLARELTSYLDQRPVARASRPGRAGPRRAAQRERIPRLRDRRRPAEGDR
ncbi:MAG: PAS domain S-box protein [Trueperaceae bacterium]|nr:PAS domain S-box protein [Trueperaceae bacterium]